MEPSIGQTLELSHNGHTSLTRETAQAGSFPTFNFEVEGWHTYFVGKTGVWVHNDSVDYSRPGGFRDGIRDKVWDAAKDENGTVHDPLTGDVIHDGDAWDMGHRPGYEWDKLEDYARSHHWSREKLLDTYNDPKYYQPELPPSNQGHEGEEGGDVNHWLDEFGP